VNGGFSISLEHGCSTRAKVPECHLDIKGKSSLKNKHP
jgi:hypothetical protein